VLAMLPEVRFSARKLLFSYSLSLFGVPRH
jgi:hypothetical protein